MRGEFIMAFELPALPYAYDALEPVIDADTMRFHHDKHHATYVANLNKALEAHPELFERSVEFLIAHLNHLPEDIISQNRVWLYVPPPLFRTAPLMSSGRLFR